MHTNCAQEVVNCIFQTDKGGREQQYLNVLALCKEAGAVMGIVPLPEEPAPAPAKKKTRVFGKKDASA